MPDLLGPEMDVDTPGQRRSVFRPQTVSPRRLAFYALTVLQGVFNVISTIFNPSQLNGLLDQGKCKLVGHVPEDPPIVVGDKTYKFCDRCYEKLS